MTRLGGVEDAVTAAALHVDGPGGVLVLLDADDDLPCQLGPSLLDRARRVRSVEIGVVVARSEFESWFLAAAPSLAGYRDLADPLDAPSAPEDLRGAKEWLSGRMAGHPYEPTVDQAKLASQFDLDMARTASPSFDKLWRDVSRLLGW